MDAATDAELIDRTGASHHEPGPTPPRALDERRAEADGEAGNEQHRKHPADECAGQRRRGKHRKRRGRDGRREEDRGAEPSGHRDGDHRRAKGLARPLRNGLERSSSRTVVERPWPGWRMSAGSQPAARSKEWSMAAGSAKGRSVRPIDPTKMRSPGNAMPSVRKAT